MDFLFMISGLLCLAETVMLCGNSDFLIFYGGSLDKKDYDLNRLYKAERVVFFIDAVCCLTIGVIKPGVAVEAACIVIALVTVVVHCKILSGKRFKVK